MPKYKTPQRRRVAQAPAPTRGRKPPDRSRALRAWVVLGAGAVAFLVVLWLGTKLIGGGGDDDVAILGGTAPTGATGSTTTDFAEPPPPGTVSVEYPRGAAGTRLHFQIVGVGRTPSRCTPESVRIGEKVRGVYHHSCGDEQGLDRYYFLVRMTNTTQLRVPVTLDGFLVEGADGKDRPPLPTPPLGTSADRFYPASTTLGPRVSMTRWVTIDGSGGVRPERLIYADGPETLIIRIPSTWV